MNGRILEEEPLTPEEYYEDDYNTPDWNIQNVCELIQSTDAFQVKQIARSILQGELSGELSDDIYAYICENCYFMLHHIIQNAVMYMKRDNRKEFRIRDFKNALFCVERIDNLPPSVLLDDSYKFAVHNYP